MKVLLTDLDAEKRRKPFPNLALMKLSAYHKQKGDDVYLNFPLCDPDITYASCVFTWHKPQSQNPAIEYGGSGINFDVLLPPEIEHKMPDYSLYPDLYFSMGFTSRGCCNKCSFCLVPLKEGGIRANASVREFYNPALKRLILLDNNILASENCDETFDELIELQVETDINQGMDIRLLNDRNVWQLKKIKTKVLRFAFDNMAYESQARQGLKLLLGTGISPRKFAFYVLVGFRQNDEAIERIKLLQSYGVDVYPMIYKDASGKEPDVHYDFKETIQFHGARGNLRKFLRITGRLE